MAEKKAVFIGATGQHVGKTTISLGLNALLRKRFNNVGFIKPVGQEHVFVQETPVDKDVYLFRKLFSMESDWVDMSPVIIPQGFTRDYLDGKIPQDALIKKIAASFERIKNRHEFTVVEGTGHIGVGSIIGLSNADVAKALNLEMVILTSGGLGSSFDELSLNLSLCSFLGVPVRGIIINKVIDTKMEMIKSYFTKALSRYNIPLIGCIPFVPFLTKPTMQDFETLFKTPLITGFLHRFSHFINVRLMAGSAEAYQDEVIENELIITPATRDDIIEIILERHSTERAKGNSNFHVGMILTGRHPPSSKTLGRLQNIDIPILYAPLCSYEAMRLITSFTAKLLLEDREKIEAVIDVVEKHVDLEQLIGIKKKFR